MRMRNASQSEAASNAASVFKHNADVCGHSGHAHRGCLGGGPGGEYRLFEVLFCEYAMRDSQRPQPTLLVSSNTKWAYAATADMSVKSISEGPGVNIVYSRSHFANTQFKAVRDRIRRCSGLPAPNVYRFRV